MMWLKWTYDGMEKDSRGDYAHIDDIENETAKLKDRIAELEAENFKLSAGQCTHPKGIIGDDYGNATCPLLEDWKNPGTLKSSERVRILLFDGSILVGCIKQADGDFWWCGSTNGERWINESTVIGWLPEE